MKCPKCGKEISWVRVYSECWQAGTLVGRTIAGYGPVHPENVGNDICGIGCPECGEDISESVGK